MSGREMIDTKNNKMISSLFNAYVQSRQQSKTNESDQIKFKYIRNKQDSADNKNETLPITKKYTHKF